MGEGKRLTLSDIKIKSIDHKSPFLYPSRTLELKFSRGSVNTPNRAATLYEYNQKGRVPTEITLENTVSYSLNKLNLSKLKTFLLSNGAFHRILERTVEANSRMKYSHFHFNMIQPTVSPGIDEESGEESESASDYLVSNSSKREVFLRLITQMQFNLGDEIVTLPYLELPSSEYAEVVREFAKSVRSNNKEPMVVFDLDYAKNVEKFEEALDGFMKKADVRLFALSYKSYTRHAVSYDKLSKYVEKEIAFVSFDVERSDKRNSDISTVHYMPFLGNDIYGIKTPRYFPPKDNVSPGEKREKKEKLDMLSKEKIKFFEPSSLLVVPSARRMGEKEKVLKEIDQSGNSYLKRILGDYDVMDKDPTKVEIFGAFARVHELNASTTEFGKVRKLIDSGESTEYAAERSYLKSSLDSFKQSRKKKK